VGLHCERVNLILAARCKAWVCGRLLAGIMGLNPAGGMVVGRGGVCCQRSMRRVDHLSREILPSVVCPNVVMNLR
jgi:hypothetical protein